MSWQPAHAEPRDHWGFYRFRAWFRVLGVFHLGEVILAEDGCTRVEADCGNHRVLGAAADSYQDATPPEPVQCRNCLGTYRTRRDLMAPQGMRL